MARPHPIWSATWRLLLATLIGAAAFVGVWSVEIMENPDLPPAPLLIDLALGVGALMAVGFRNRAPLAIGLVVCAVGGVSALAVGASLLAIVSLSARRRASWIAAAVGVTLAFALAWQAVAGGLGLTQPSGTAEWLMLVLILPLALAVPVLVGTNLGARRALIVSLRAETERARDEQEARADSARVAERTRIAQELHDELGHRLSLIALHAGALEYRDDVPADRARQTAGVIRASAEQALLDVRSTLGMLRRSGVDDEPSPDVRERIAQLVTAATDAGMPLATRLDPGVQAALLKDTPPAELVAAVRQAASGGTPLSPAVTRRLVQH
ncbi:sensor histidine kinase [Microbacterium sp. 18062]|uniref:sensor histidine kinase n=1 Tax=Microbacterium sp. 18062 TaxID=2681410 RepID=UPI00135BA7DA|nr:histidine kinase [Microbacterium sp. 18062]